MRTEYWPKGADVLCCLPPVVIWQEKRAFWMFLVFLDVVCPSVGSLGLERSLSVDGHADIFGVARNAECALPDGDPHALYGGGACEDFLDDFCSE